MKFLPTEVLDSVLAKHILQINEDSTVMEVFRIYDEITLMRDRDPVVSYRIIAKIKDFLDKAMVRDNMTLKELGNRAMWRDEDN
jgi:hypothetical protein